MCNLERQGYGVYFPRVRHKTLRRGGWSETIAALFPRYLFVRLNTAMQSLAPIRSTLGVAHLVRFGTEYVPVPHAVVDGLMRREDADGLHRIGEPTLKPGEPIRVIDGALAGVEAIFQYAASSDRVIVLLELLGRQTPVKLPMAAIAPAA